MSTAPDPNPAPVRRRRRHSRPRGWKAVPKSVMILGGICLLSLIVIPFAKTRRAIPKQPPAAFREGKSRYTPSLSITEAALDRHSGTLKGIVENHSEKTMDDVQVYYEVRDDQGKLLGAPVVKIGLLKPHERVRFETDKLPPGVTQFDMQSLTGNPR